MPARRLDRSRNFKFNVRIFILTIVLNFALSIMAKKYVIINTVFEVNRGSRLGLGKRNKCYNLHLPFIHYMNSIFL